MYNRYMPARALKASNTYRFQFHAKGKCIFRHELRERHENSQGQECLALEGTEGVRTSLQASEQTSLQTFGIPLARGPAGLSQRKASPPSRRPLAAA